MSASVLQLSWTLDQQNVVCQFDASISESHVGTAQVTDLQVETGPNITDDIRPLPIKLSLEAFVTNTPINAGILGPTSVQSGSIETLPLSRPNGLLLFPSAKTLQFATQFNRVTDVYNALLSAQAGGALVDVTTSLKNYYQFAITSVTAPRDAEHGNAVVFAIELQQIITVSVTNVASPAPLHQKKSVGQQPTRKATTTETQTMTSTAAKLLGITD